MTRSQATIHEPQEAGNARLRQVRAFIEQVEPVQPDIMQMLLGALRGRLVIGALAGLVLGVMLAAAILLSTRPVYQSQGLMRIVAREAKILYANSDDSRLRLFDAFVAAEVTYLTSRPVLDRTLEKLQAANIEKGWPENVGDIAKAVNITSQKGLVTISAKSARGPVAAALVNGLLDAYGELRMEQTEDRQHFRTRELVGREASLVEQLKAIDDKILDVGEEYGQDAIGKAHSNKIVQIDEVSTRIDELTTTINQLETVGFAADADTGDAEIKRSMLLDNSMASMTYDRAKKAAEAASLEKRYRADHPKVISAKAEIAVLDKAIDERRAQIATLGRTGALTQRDQKEDQSVDELKQLLAKLQERKKALETEALDLIGRIVKLGYLKEERAQTRERLDETRRVLEEVRVESRNALPGVTEVVARGSVPDKPFEDKRKPMAMVGMMGGLGFGFALVALWGMVRPTIRSESDLAALGKSVMPAGAVASPDESVHKLRNTLHIALARHPASQGRTISVIGGGKSPGASAFALSLAKSFAEAGSRTALIDANLNNPALSGRLGAGEEPGITDWMPGTRTDALPLARSGAMTLLAAGTNRAVRDSALSPRDVSQILETLTSAHDIVVADCGAANRVLSSTLFTSQTDLAVLVLRRGVSLGEARSAVASILAASRRQILVVLTGRPAGAVPGWLSKAALASAEALAAQSIKLRKKTGIGKNEKNKDE
ncbi:MAG: hypothetical protein MUE79_05320, partial [Nitratireductor sp.]|nr:hypothetical protein [Nitratireductor sp.]